MKLLQIRSLILLSEVLFLAIAAISQVTVDATGPIRERQRSATAGHGGGVGRKLALRVAIELHTPSPNANGATVLDFVLTNSGEGDLTLPISPNPGDMEPMDPTASYTLKCLSLRVTSDKKAASILPGGADLYGSPSFPATLTTLASGSSIRVLARVVLPPVSYSSTNTSVLVGSAMLNEETVTTLKGKTFLDTREIGFARSAEYSIESLFRLPD
jgi:hypothetical protein